MNDHVKGALASVNDEAAKTPVNYVQLKVLAEELVTAIADFSASDVTAIC